MGCRAVLLLVGAGLLLWLALCAGPYTGQYVSENKHSNDKNLKIIGLNALSAIDANLDASMSAVVKGARLLLTNVQEVVLCELGDYERQFISTGPLASVLAAWTIGVSTPNLQGVGVMTFDGVDNGNPDFSNKVSFEVTNGTIVSPPCAEFLYGLTDNGTVYNSYCMNSAGVVTSPEVKYSGPDYGATPVEKALMLDASARSAWGPVFDLVGRQSLSFYLSKAYCFVSASSNYALVFAQTSLTLISEQLARLNIGSGVAFIIERDSGLLVAASIPNQVVTVTINSWGGKEQARVAAVNATYKLIREAAGVVLAGIDSIYILGSFSSFSSDDLAIFAQPYEYPDSGAELGWIKVVVLKKSDYVTTFFSGESKTLYAVLMVVTFLIVALFVSLAIYRSSRSDEFSRSNSMHPLT